MFLQIQANEGHCSGQCAVTLISPFRTEGLFPQWPAVWPHGLELSALWNCLHDEQPSDQGHTLVFPGQTSRKDWQTEGPACPSSAQREGSLWNCRHFSQTAAHPLPNPAYVLPGHRWIPRDLSSRPLHANLHLRISFPGNPIYDRQFPCSLESQHMELTRPKVTKMKSPPHLCSPGSQLIKETQGRGEGETLSIAGISFVAQQT